jgi:hypothetical protein
MVLKFVLGGAAALALLTGTAQAQSPKDFPEVADGSFAEAGGSKVLNLSLVIPADRKAVWSRFTTTEGYKAWATPMAKVDFGLNGLIEASYDAKAKLGDADNIRNRIVAYVPEHMLAQKNENAPASLPGREKFGEIITVIELEDAPGGTKVTITGVGYKPGEPYDALFRHFAWGNAYSLMELKNSFVRGPVDWQSRLARQQARAASDTVTGKR